MKDISEFEKLFKVNFPIIEHHQYYINTLMRSPFYAGLGKLIEEYELYEIFAEEEGYKSAKSYKLDYALPKLKEYLLGTEAYEKMMSNDFGNLKLRTKDNLRNNDNMYLLSLDFTAANYNSLKTYDSKKELYTSWEELCISLDIHPTLSKSKSFRQYVFGNTNPKRLQKTQHKNIVAIVDKLIENNTHINEEDFVFISHDEFIFRVQPDIKKGFSVNSRINWILMELPIVCKELGIKMPTHYKVFKNEPIGAGMCIQTIYNPFGSVLDKSLTEKHKVLFKVPGNKFFKYFKTHILEEEFDKRDLMFMSDGEIAVWSTEDDSISEVIIPEGELSYDEIEKEYPVLLNKLKSEVVGLNKSQLRKIVNVALVLSDELF